jgi:hypothetical protein
VLRLRRVRLLTVWAYDGSRVYSFEPTIAFLLFGSLEVADDGFAAGTSAADAVDGFFAGFDMEILCSVHAAALAAPQTPHLGHEAGGGRISGRVWRPRLEPVPLRSARKASPFWIMLLLSSRAFEHGMID